MPDDQSILRWRENSGSPYESPIEELFAFNAEKYVAEHINIREQVDVPTLLGTYRVDFMLSRVVVECDGEEFHENRERDRWRDLLILGTDTVDAIYRISGALLHYRPEDALYCLSLAEGQLFSERGRCNLKRLASPRVLGLTPQTVHTSFDFERRSRKDRWMRERWELAERFGPTCRTLIELAQRGHDELVRENRKRWAAVDGSLGPLHPRPCRRQTKRQTPAGTPAVPAPHRPGLPAHLPPKPPNFRRFSPNLRPSKT